MSTTKKSDSSFPCGRRGCAGIAHWQPVLIVYAEGREPKEEESASLELAILVCDDHKTTLVSHYLKPRDWQDVVATFHSMGYATPDRKTARITFRKL